MRNVDPNRTSKAFHEIVTVTQKEQPILSPQEMDILQDIQSLFVKAENLGRSPETGDEVAVGVYMALCYYLPLAVIMGKHADNRPCPKCLAEIFQTHIIPANVIAGSLVAADRRDAEAAAKRN